MSNEFNHTIVLARDSKTSAKFLADMLGLSAVRAWGPFQIVTTDNGANTYRLMSGFASHAEASGWESTTDEQASIDQFGSMPKVVFSSTLKAPLPWANTRLVSGDAVEAVRAMKQGRPLDAHARQPHPVPEPGGPRGPVPGGRLPGDHREDRP